jgi:hypothetical protein
MTMGYLFKDFHTKPVPKFHHTLLVTGWAEVPPFAGECQQVFVAAVFAFHTGKTVAYIAAIQITIDHLLDIRSPETILPGELFVIALHKGFKIILYTMIIIRILQVARPVFGCWQ